MVLLASGSAVPADCRVNEGEIEVDEAALTGESLPVTMFRGLYCMDVCMYALFTSLGPWTETLLT